jgi:hypothetical protein
MHTQALLTVMEIWKLLYNYNKGVGCRSIMYLVSALLVVLPSYCIIDGMQYIWQCVPESLGYTSFYYLSYTVWKYVSHWQC